MSGRRRALVLRQLVLPTVAVLRLALLTAAFLLLAGCIADAFAAGTWRVGAAKRDITPPSFDAAADAALFPTCPPALFDGPRIFGLQEPYRDLDGSGAFNYSPDVTNPEFGQGADPYCDANANGRYDGMYSAGGIDHLLEWVHDPIFARAVAVIDADDATAVIVSIEAIGLFENLTKRMRARVRQDLPAGADVELFFSADHNESSPDAIGLYGAPSNGVTGTRSGINDYYQAFLVERVADAALAAIASAVPARLRVAEVMPPPDLPTRLSHNFPTTNDDRSPAAINPKLRVLQGVAAAGGAPIFTLLSLSAHNQQVGHAGDGEVVTVGGVPRRVNRAVSGDWPGAFHAYLEGQGVGMPVFLVGDNGSIEDPVQLPEVPDTFAQAAQTGVGLGDAVLAALPLAQDLTYGAIVAERLEFTVPLENNLFAAAGAAGIFGDRQLYTAGQPTGRVGNELITEVGVVDVGPDLQFLAHPSESFPALSVGSPWGIEEASCPERANPAVPTWHARARHRLQIGLANDLIGYLLPAWGFSTIPGVVDTTCVNDQDDVDQAGHQHKLETESVGPTAGNMVANNLAGLLDTRPDPTARIRLGRFVMPDGTLSRRAPGAIGIVVTDGICTSLAATETTFVALPSVVSAGGRTPDAVGGFMDFDGAPQTAPDILSRGMWAGGTAGTPAVRYYVNVYPALEDDSGCSDGLACNGIERCDGATGQCVAGSAVDCTSAADACNAGMCAEPGVCVATPIADGTPCDSGDVCSAADRCSQGTCVAGGGGDSDGDQICDIDDDCPGAADPSQADADDDGMGDACDPEDGPLHLTRARARGESQANAANGSIALKGDFAATPPISTGDGIIVRITDTSSLDQTITWSATDCQSTSRRTLCRTPDRLRRATFKPKAGATFFTITLKRLTISAPFTAPLTATLRHSHVFDLRGTASSCTTTRTALRCRQP